MLFQQTVDVEAMTAAFMDEFGGQLAEAELDALSSGGFRSGPQPEILPDPATVNPVKDPQLALAILKAGPASEIVPAEQPFVLPLLPYLRKAKQAPPPEVAVLVKNYDFYLVRYGLDAIPRGNEQFESVEYCVDYPADHLTQTMTPDTELATKFAAKASVKLGLNASLGFQLSDFIPPGLPVAVGLSPKVEVDTGFIYSWDYRALRADVIATGAKSSFSRWMISNPQKLIGAIECAAVLRVPSGTSQLSFAISGTYTVTSGIPWWKRRTARTFRTLDPIILSV